MKVFIFGAGASAGTLKVPVAAQFGAGLRAVNRQWGREYPALARVAKHLGGRTYNFGLEPVWTCLDFYAKLHAAIPWQKPWEDESRNIKKALLAVYGDRIDDLAEEVPLNGPSTLARLLRDDVRGGDLLVSFNYDTIVERLATRIGHRLKAISTNARSPKSMVGIVKPHGSTSWSMNLQTRAVRVTARNGGPRLSSVALEDVDRGIEPILLGAVPIKSELIEQVQGQDWKRIYRSVATQWFAVLNGLARASELVVVGYSFPPEDLYGRFMLAEAMRRRRGRKLRISFYELPRNRKRCAGMIRDAFGKAIRGPFYRGKVVGQ